MKKLIIITIFTLISTAYGLCQEYDTFVDTRDSTKYKIVKIGEHWWFAENLNFNIPIESDCYKNNEDYCKTYGRLYTWSSARKACPVGWHLPDKYDSLVGERGTTVSGGQKQRLAIARALAIKPKILILDDATSSVDVDTEYAIQKHFEEVFKDCTTFLITQRLSSVRNADRIVVMDKGRIKQIGTHEELLSKEGIYKKLYLTLKIEERA